MPFVASTLIYRIARSTNDIVTPANIISGTGLGLSMYGALHIHEVGGVVLFCAGRLLDILDGPIARKTYPGSRVGAIVDASFDKIAVLIALAAAWNYHAAPVVVLLVMALINIINSAANMYSARQGGAPVTSMAGKYFMLGYIFAFSAFVLGNALNGADALDMVGLVVFVITTPVAIKAAFDYSKAAWHARQLKR